MKHFVLTVYFVFFFVMLHAQDSLKRSITHTVKIGFGLGVTDYFSGIGVSISYQLQPSPKYFISVGFQGTEEFVLFGRDAQTLQEFSLLIHKTLFSKKIKGSMGTGFSYLKHYLDIEHFNTLQPGTYVPDEYQNVHIKKMGVPLELQFATNKEKGTIVAISARSNFNSINTHYLFQIHFGYIFR
jgi:hypothetical protein